MPLRKTILAFAGVLCLLAGCATAGGGATAAGNVHAVSAEVETRHVAWAKPLEGGPVDVLLVAPRHTLRDAVEMAQRLDVRLTTVALWDRARLGCDPESEPPRPKGFSTEEVEALLQAEFAKAHDVIVLGNFDLGVLSVELQSALFRAVSRGAGLVLANHDAAPGIVYETFIDALSPLDDMSVITRGAGARSTAEWSFGEDIAFAATYGEGRFVALAYGEDRPAAHCIVPALTRPLHALPEYFDAYLSLACRAILWAAGREPPLRVASVEAVVPEGPPEEEIPPDLPEEFVQSMRDSVLQEPIRRFNFMFDTPADRDYAVRVQVRDPNRGLQVTYASLPKLKKGESTYLAEVLTGPGHFLLDFWLETRKGVALWHTEPVEVRGWPTFAGLRINREFLLPNDALDLSVEVRAHFGNTRPFTLYARGVDSFGRVVAEIYVPAPGNGGRVPIRLNFSDLIARRVKVEVFALDGPPHPAADWELNMAACAVRLLPVRQPRIDRVPGAVAVAPAAFEYNARAHLAALARYGVDAAYTGDGDAAHRFLMELNLRPIADLGIAPGRDGCLANSTYQDAERKRVADLATYFARGGILDYSLGHPVCSGGGAEPCSSSECQAAAQDALKRAGMDGGIEEPADHAARTAVRLHMDAVRVGHLRGLRDTVLGVDPQARVGMRPPEGGAWDWPGGIASWSDGLPLLCVPASSPWPEQLAAFQPAGAFTGVAMDPARTEPRHAGWLPWRAATLGIPEVWLPEPYGTALRPADSPLLYPDGTASPALEALAASVHLLREGPGPLLLAAERPKPAIAVLDSTASRRLHEVMAVEGADYAGAQTHVQAALNEAGLSCTWVDAERLTPAALEGVQLLVLPMASALSDAACNAIQRFAESGGAVFADLLPGTHDGNGVPRGEAPLAATFGVRFTPGDWPRGNEESGIPLLDARISLDSAHASLHALFGEEVPAGLATGESGEGTVLLNFPFPAADSGGPAPRAAHAMWEAVLAAHAPVLDMGGADFQGTVTRLRYGAADLYVLVRDPAADGGKRLRLRFERGGHVYDAVAGKKAVTRSAYVNPAPGEGAVVTRLPYDVASVKVAAPEEVMQGARLPVLVKVETGGAETGAHLVRVSLETLPGEPLAHYTRWVECARGSGETYLPLARNERPGIYHVVARDLLTGLTGRATVKVLPGAETAGW